MATAFLPSYFVKKDDVDFEGEEFTGHAYFGIDSGRKTTQENLLKMRRQTFFESLGFKPRVSGDYGTTVVLPGCNFFDSGAWRGNRRNGGGLSLLRTLRQEE